MEEPGGQALFGILVEGLADRFEPALCDVYARLFSQAVAQVSENVDPASLVARYQRVRRPRPISGEPRRVFVLSRVTLGADVAVTSVLLAAAKQRFPHAEIVFVGPRKNYELFAGDPRLRHADMAYRRGGLRERLAVWDAAEGAAGRAGLGGDRSRFPPHAAGPAAGLPGGPLPPFRKPRVRRRDGPHASRTCRRLGRRNLRRVRRQAVRRAGAGAGPVGTSTHAVSLGVGENPAKRIPDPFEEELLALLAAGGAALVIDKGAGGEEAARVERAVERSGVKAAFWEGSFAGFAAIIAASRLYVGYDSAGQHVAAACGVPLVSIFAGFPAPRMFHRWRPTGERATVIRVDRPDPLETLERVRAAIAASS